MAKQTPKKPAKKAVNTAKYDTLPVGKKGKSPSARTQATLDSIYRNLPTPKADTLKPKKSKIIVGKAVPKGSKVIKKQTF